MTWRMVRMACALVLAGLAVACGGAGPAEPGVVVISEMTSTPAGAAAPVPTRFPTLPAPAPETVPPWSQAGGNAMRNWQAPVSGPAKLPSLLWQAPLPGPVTGSPIAGTDGMVYVATEGGLVLAVNRDGQEVWRFAGAGEIEWTPALAPGGPLFVIASQGVFGTLYALDPAGGQVQWEQALASGPASPPLLAPQGTLLFIDYLNAVHCLELSGTERWTWKEENFRPATLVMDREGVLYAGGPQLSSAGTPVYALNPSDGTVLWDLDVGTPAVDRDGQAYFLGSWLVRVGVVEGRPQVEPVSDQEAEQIGAFRTLPLGDPAAAGEGPRSFLVRPSFDPEGIAYGFLYTATLVAADGSWPTPDPAALQLSLAAFDWATRQLRWQVPTGLEAVDFQPWAEEGWLTDIAIGPDRRLYWAAHDQLYAYGANE